MFNGGFAFAADRRLPAPGLGPTTLPILFQHSSQPNPATSDSNPQTKSSCMDFHYKESTTALSFFNGPNPFLFPYLLHCELLEFDFRHIDRRITLPYSPNMAPLTSRQQLLKTTSDRNHNIKKTYGARIGRHTTYQQGNTASPCSETTFSYPRWSSWQPWEQPSWRQQPWEPSEQRPSSVQQLFWARP